MVDKMGFQIPLITEYIAPSKRLGFVLSKRIKDKLPAGDWQVGCIFQNETDYKGNKFYTNALNSSGAVKFVLTIAQTRDEVYPEPTFNAGFLFGSVSKEKRTFKVVVKQYVLKGWIEWPIHNKHENIDVFFDVMGNVTSDLDTALTMTLL